MLGEILRLAVVADDAADISVDVVRVAHVKEANRITVALLGSGYREAHFTRDGW